jgi:C1A family cysteine protease
MPHRYGWRPDKPDRRDRRLVRRLNVALPPYVDLTPLMPPVYDQGELGSCTGNAIAGAIEYARKKQGLADFVPSRLFIYYNERDIEGTVSSDAGAEIRDGVKSVVSLGACGETDWPYDISQFTAKPSDQCYAAAKTDLVTRYARVDQTLDGLRDCLAAGFPVVFGFTVYESFESGAVASSGIVPMPGTDESVLGGHAVVMVGYDDDRQTFIVRNSWGPGWGRAGYFLMPYAYPTGGDLASDFWQIDAVTAASAG